MTSAEATVATVAQPGGPDITVDVTYNVETDKYLVTPQLPPEEKDE